MTLVQLGGVEAVVDPVLDLLGSFSGADAILCTSPSLGPVVELVNDPKVIRVDRPVVTAAAEIGPKQLVVTSLASAGAAALDLLDSARGADLQATEILCDGAWPHLLRGEDDAYFAEVVAQVSDVVLGHDCVVIPQPSLAGIAPLLEDRGVPVLTSPGLAVARALMVFA